MKHKYHNLDDQINRMKSLMTEERLYGNLIPHTHKKLITESKGGWLDVFLRNVDLGSTYVLNGKKVKFIKDSDGNVLMKKLGANGKWRGGKPFTFNDIVGEAALKKKGLFDPKNFESLADLENYYRVGMKDELTDAMELLGKNIGLDEVNPGSAREFAEDFADDMMRSLKQQDGTGANKIELLLKSDNFWKYTDTDGVRQTIETLEQFEKRLNDILENSGGGKGKSLKEVMDMVPGMRQTLYNGYKKHGPTTVTVAKKTVVVGDGKKLGDVYEKGGKKYMRTNSQGKSAGDTMIPDELNTINPQTNKPYTQEEYIDAIRKNLDIDTEAKVIVGDIKVDDIFTGKNEIDLEKMFDNYPDIESGIRASIKSNRGIMMAKAWKRIVRSMPLGIGISGLGGKWPMKYQLKNMKNKVVKDLTKGQRKWFDMHYGADTQTIGEETYHGWRVTEKNAAELGQPVGSINLRAKQLPGDKIKKLQKDWIRLGFGRSSEEEMSELFKDFWGKPFKNTSQIFDGVSAWWAFRRASIAGNLVIPYDVGFYTYVCIYSPDVVCSKNGYVYMEWMGRKRN